MIENFKGVKDMVWIGNDPEFKKMVLYFKRLLKLDDIARLEDYEEKEGEKN